MTPPPLAWPAANIPGVPPLEYLTYARSYYEQPHSPLVDLGSSGTPWVTADELGVEWDSFTDPAGPEALRAAIAAHYSQTPATTGLARGTSGALYTVLRALYASGARLAVESPVYEPLLRVPEGIGYDVVRVPRRSEAGWTLDPQAVLAALGRDGRLALLSDPHNPSGATLERAAIGELAERLAARGGFVLVDEAYRDFHVPRDGVQTAASIAPNVIALNSLTKVYGLGWARVGWLFGPPAVVRAAEEVGYHIAGSYGFDYAAWGRAAFRQIDRLRERTLRLAAGKLERLAAFVEAHADRLAWHRPTAGLIAFVCRRDGMPMQPLAEALPRYGVLAADGRFFGEPAGLRIGCAVPVSEFERGLAALGAAFDAQTAGE